MSGRTIQVACLLLLTTPFVAIPIPLAASNGAETAKALRHNVFSVVARPLDKSAKRRGFAFVFGQRGGYLYLATANHVLRGNLDPEDLARQIKVQSFGSDGRPIKADLLPYDDEELDVGFIRVPVSERQLWLSASVADQDVKPGESVWFIGKRGLWRIPKQPGHIVRAQGAKLTMTSLSAEPGTSGAPIVTGGGIAGLVVNAELDEVVATSISEVREIAQAAGFPWNLTAYSEPRAYSGEWSYEDELTGGSGQLEIAHEDAAHVGLGGTGPSDQGRVEGTAVIDGKEFRVWLKGRGKKGGRSGVLQLADGDSGRVGVIVEGNLEGPDSKGRERSRFVRLVRTSGGLVHPQARELLKGNPLRTAGDPKARLEELGVELTSAALLDAMINGNGYLARLLLSSGVDWRTAIEGTPLLHTLIRESPSGVGDIIALLFRYGLTADETIKISYDQSLGVVVAAAMHGSAESISTLADQGADLYGVIATAITYDNDALLPELVERGASLSGGLEAAMRRDRPRTFKYLEGEGARMFCPLEVAVSDGRVAMVSHLLSDGRDPTCARAEIDELDRRSRAGLLGSHRAAAKKIHSMLERTGALAR